MFSIYTWVFQMVSLLWVSPQRPCLHFSSALYVPHPTIKYKTKRAHHRCPFTCKAKIKFCVCVCACVCVRVCVCVCVYVCVCVCIYIYLVRCIASGRKFWNGSCRNVEAKIFPSVHDDPFPQSTYLRFCLTLTSLTPCLIFSQTRHILALQAAVQRMGIVCCALRTGVILKILSLRLCRMHVLADWITALV